MSAVTWSPVPATAPVLAPSCRPAARPQRHLHVVPTPQPAAMVRLRVTRAGRLTLTLLAVAVCVAFALTAWAGRGTAAGVGAPGHAITVHAGQTLSQIALAELPGLPLDEAITRIQLANTMSSTAVRAGAVLTIPGR